MTSKSFESFSSLWLLLVFTKKVSVFYFMVVDVDKKCQERKKKGSTRDRNHEEKDTNEIMRAKFSPGFFLRFFGGPAKQP